MCFDIKQTASNKCQSIRLIWNAWSLVVTLLSWKVSKFCAPTRQHTLAFTPSSGKMYSFGLGGNGQLGTHSTCNRKSPAPIKGPFIFSSAPMDKGTLHHVVLFKLSRILTAALTSAVNEFAVINVTFHLQILNSSVVSKRFMLEATRALLTSLPM